jgi:hypothetical protein
MAMGHSKKRYYGAIVSEIKAAKIYDKFAILAHGINVRRLSLIIQAKTNFSYMKREIETFLAEEDDNLELRV